MQTQRLLRDEGSAASYAAIVSGPPAPGSAAEHLRLPVDRMPLACLALDANCRIVEWNAAAERIFGYSKSEVLGMGPPFAKLLPPSAWKTTRGVFDRLCEGDMAAHGINENLTKDGRTITCEWYNTPVFDADGSFQGVIALAQDITQRRQTEEALRLSEERFRQIAASISEVFWLTTADKQEILYVSPAYEVLWGRSCEELYASPHSWTEAIHSDDRARVRRAWLTGQTIGEFEEEYRIVRPDGTVRWVRDRAFPVRDVNDRVVRFAGVTEDITERRHLEAQLRQAQKMEAVGQLAGGVAHDFNNLLTVITGYSDLLLEAPRDEPPAREMIDEIRKAGERSAALTRQLLAFSRKQVLTPKILDVNAVVRDTEKMLQRLIGEDIELLTVLRPQLGAVKADVAQLEHALLNLAVNARDAMPHGGKLTIETADVELGAGYAAKDAAKAGVYVMLAVTDTGTGMSEEVKRRIFEPFFTTKGPGHGTGLGLAVVHGFVKQSGGSVDVYSEEGVGTCFKIYLPRIAPGAGVRAARADSACALPRGTETILLVEDERGVRALTSRVLERCGYTVLQACCGDEALRIAQSGQHRIGLLVTDVVMPGLGGRALAEQLLAACPDLKVLYVSGYTSEAVVRHGVLHDEVNFLQKPFSPAALAQTVRDVLDR